MAKKKESPQHLPYLSIVAIIAIVAVVVLVLALGGSRSAESTEEASLEVVDENGNIAGDAIRLSANKYQIAYRQGYTPAVDVQPTVKLTTEDYVRVSCGANGALLDVSDIAGGGKVNPEELKFCCQTSTEPPFHCLTWCSLG